MNIEIKELGFEEQLVDMLNEVNIKEKIIISSFKMTALKKVKSIDSSLSVAYIYNIVNPNLNHLKNIDNIDAIHPRKNLVTRNLVLKANSLGLPIRAWTVDQPKIALKLAKLNIDTIVTNNPRVIIQSLDIEKNSRE